MAKKKQDSEEAAVAVMDAPFRKAEAMVEERIPASQFRRYPTNREPLKEDVKQMAASIRTNGQLQPITARPVPDPDGGEGTVLEIVFGETRWLACCQLATNYEVRSYVVPMTDKEAARIHAVENFRRTELGDLDQARTMQNMRDNGWTIDEVCREVGLGQAMVYRKLKLLELSAAAQVQLREGNLDVQTAGYIVSLPEEEQELALLAVTQPVKAAKPLGRVEAIELIKEQFIKPAEEKLKWEERKEELKFHFKEEAPDAVFLDYAKAKEAGHYQSGYKRAESNPDYGDLSEAARAREVLIPTWGDLARKHGGTFYIGISQYGGDPLLYIEPEPLMAAERAAFDEDPGACVFIHPQAVAKAKSDAERRRLDEERRKQEHAAEMAAADSELQLAIDAILDGKLAKTKEKKFCERVAVDLMVASYSDALDGTDRLIPIPENLAMDQEDYREKKIREWMRKKELTGYEALGRLIAAAYIDKQGEPTIYYLKDLAEVMFGGDAFKRADFPVIAKYEPVESPQDEQDAQDDAEGHHVAGATEEDTAA